MTTPQRRPEWLKARAPGGPNHHELKVLTNQLQLHTVCESARCPNLGECWEQRTATFMILGDVCTRRCGFCAVPKGAPLPLDYEEPERVARAVAHLGLKYAVVTSVNRDDRKDGGAEIFALTIQAIRRLKPDCLVEVLIPDFQGSQEALATVIAARPDVLDHNIETVPRLYREVRPGARYEQSLNLIASVRKVDPAMATKSGMMLGLGEDSSEVLAAMKDLLDHGCQILTLGQYLRPSLDHLPIARYYSPAEFAEFKREGERMGFRHVEAGPLVRSSYHARSQFAATRT
ncbi:MAG: lipoyl synthase [Acidobacteria bacterium]|nr:lipoyl synthase [Acidobacteriota bacterium]